MIFNSHMELDLCFKLVNGSLIWYASFTNIFYSPCTVCTKKNFTFDI